MLRTVAAKMAWVGRTASMVFGLALMLALVFGVATTALSATGGNFILGKSNAAKTASKLTSTVAGPALVLVNNGTSAAATALNITVADGKAPLTVNATAGKATNLDADEVDGVDGEEFVRLDPATAQGGSLHVDGLVRSGSETGTSESPATGLGASYEGVVTRRVVSADRLAGAVIARTDELRLERDGTFGGMRIAWDGGTHSTNTVSCVWADGSGAGGALAKSLPGFGQGPSIGGTEPGSVTLFTNQDAGTYVDCSFGDPVRAGHVTQVELQRAYEDSTWVGTVTSTFNQ